MRFLFVLTLFAFISCTKDTIILDSDNFEFGQPQKVSMTGYDDHIMEPFLTRDGTILFFNNLNQSNVNTDLHYASKINDSTFKYEGKVKGANSEFLDGVPSMDDSNNFYFVSTRSYEQTLSTIYCGLFSHDTITNVHLVTGLSKTGAGWVNFDIEVSKDGNVLYTADGLFDANGGPYESDLVVAVKNDGVFKRSDNKILENINSDALEYAACISSDMLELYFTRVELPLSVSSMPQIYFATRNSVEEPFGISYKISEIKGFVEAPTISPDNKIIYYHKKEDEIHNLYLIRKK